MRRAGEGSRERDTQLLSPAEGQALGLGHRVPLRQGERDETAEASRGRVHWGRVGPARRVGFI